MNSKILRGLTLVEILVVIAIILVLVGLLLPLWRTSQASAHKSKSVNHMRQIAVAINQYIDQNGELPWPLFADVRPLDLYVKDRSLWSSPDDPYPKGANAQASHKSGYRVSYFVPVTIVRDFTEELYAVPNYGVLASLHLDKSTRIHGGSNPLYDHLGKYHLARLDGSVQLLPRELKCTSDKPRTAEANWWSIFAPGTTPSFKVQKEILGGAVFVPCTLQ